MMSQVKAHPSVRSASKASSSQFVEVAGEMVEFTKAGNISRMRAHRGNKPAIPQTHFCHLCPAKFTRITHLHRHVRTHTNERMHECEKCHTQFTRSDLLTRHKRSCGDPNANRSRRKSCQACAEGKTKCDLQQPCARCKARDRECIYARSPINRKMKRSSAASLRGGSGAGPSMTRRTDGISIDIPKIPELPSYPTSSRTSPDEEFPPSSASSASGPMLYHTQPSHPIPVHFPPQQAPFAVSDNFHGFRDMDGTSSSSYASSVLSGNTENISEGGMMGVYGSGSFAQDAMEVNNQLNALFSTELFDKFFRDSLGDSPTSSIESRGSLSGGGIEDLLSIGGNQFPFPTDVTECQPFMASGPPEYELFCLPEELATAAHISHAPPPLPTPRPARHIPHGVPLVIPNGMHHGMPSLPSPAVEPSVIPYPSEFQQYIHLFYNMFLSQMPIMHLGTFTVDGKPNILISAMQACGALYVKTHAAAKFIETTLASSREQLGTAFANAPTRMEDQVHLILAVVLLQTIGLFHQHPGQRAHSSIYHGMLIMMVRQSGMIERVHNWIPPTTDDEAAWRNWAFHETAKRALLLSYLHDCCHCIYFTLRPTLTPEEMTVPLPCEDALWRATTLQEWRHILRSPSSYGSVHERFRPPGLQVALDKLADTTTDVDPQPPLIVTPFAHFVLAHSILRTLFEDCLDKRPLDPQREGFAIQFMLHNWLQSWLRSPETPDYSQGEPTFLHDALPFYWIAQVTLLAYQENLPPFATATSNPAASVSALGEAKFRLIKEWLRHIRSFLCRGQQGTTLFWDELTKIRMKGRTHSGYQSDIGSAGDGSDSSQGLLGFFAGDV